VREAGDEPLDAFHLVYWFLDVDLHGVDEAAVKWQWIPRKIRLRAFSMAAALKVFHRMHTGQSLAATVL
jgi:hypothetical protein